MEQITKMDLYIIVNAAIQMAKQDDQIMEDELRLVQNLIKVCNLDSKRIQKVGLANNDQIATLCANLSSAKAKKVLLLTMAAIAKADGVLDPHELEFFGKLSNMLQVGTLDLEKHSCEELEKMVLKTASEAVE